MAQKATTFVRFVVGGQQENPYLLTGTFTIAKLLRDHDELAPYEIDLVDDTFAWFNEHIPCPPFTARLRSGDWTPDAVAWFKDDAATPIRRMWDLVAVLREHGVPVQFLQTESPGRIVYSDEYQVVAETPKYPIWRK